MSSVWRKKPTVADIALRMGEQSPVKTPGASLSARLRLDEYSS
jgi:hypothetical protein